MEGKQLGFSSPLLASEKSPEDIRLITHQTYASDAFRGKNTQTEWKKVRKMMIMMAMAMLMIISTPAWDVPKAVNGDTPTDGQTDRFTKWKWKRNENYLITIKDM